MLDIQAEKWSKEDREMIIREVGSVIPYGGELILVGSYAFGRSNDNKPGDLDLVFAIGNEKFASEKELQIQKGRRVSRSLLPSDGSVREALTKRLGIPVDLWFVSEFQDIGAPAMYMESGEWINKLPGDRFEGTYVVNSEGWEWVSQKNPLKQGPFC